ncbi:MAG TPA: hypothetical protein VI306_07065 [Pyrinomonadaceae bacterium]
MNTPQKSSALFLIIVCLLIGSCTGAKQFGKTLGDLAVVRSELIKRFGEDNVDVRLNSGEGGRTVSVTFMNSPLNESGEEKRRERAQQTVEIVKMYYPDIKAIFYISVNFIRANSILGIFHSTKVVDIYWFDRNAKPITSTDNGGREVPFDDHRDNEDPLEPKVSYTPTRNETEIYLGGVQLEGTPEKGVLMIPRIMVAGITEKTTPAPPESMSIDFAAFSDKRQFPGVTKITFFADKKSFDFEGEFSTSEAADGLTSEFLYLKIPYADFKQIAASEEVTVRVGKKKFALTGQQIHALFSLTRFLKD